MKIMHRINGILFRGMAPCFLVVLLSSVVHATVYYVDKNAAGTGDGLSWTNAFHHPQDAADVAASGDQIWVKNQYFTLRSPTDPVLLTMVDGVEIYGGFLGTETDPSQRGDYTATLDGGWFVGSSKVVRVVVGANNARLDGFTIKGGHTYQGAGMYNDSISLVIVNCTFTQNYAGTASGGTGGGVHNRYSTITIQDSTFDGNSASQEGGGVYNFGSSCNLANSTFFNNLSSSYGGAVFSWRISGQPYGTSINNCTFDFNHAKRGAGIYSISDPLTVTDSTFSQNSAHSTSSTGGEGGALYVQNAAASITACLFTGNSASTQGGGIFNDAAYPTVTNCHFSGNLASSDGGALYNSGSTAPWYTNCLFSGNRSRNGGGMANGIDSQPRIVNCSFIGNSAQNGGAIHNDTIYITSLFPIINSIFWGNMATTAGAQIYATAGNKWPVVEYSDVQGGYAGAGNIDADPLLVDAGAWDDKGTPADIFDDIWSEGIYGLKAGSPCIDAADGYDAPATDINGNARYDDPSVTNTGRGTPDYADMGVYEHRVWYVDLSAAGTADGSSWPNAFLHPQDAMDIAGPGDQVWVAQGTYNRKSPTDASLLSLVPGAEVYGGFLGSETTLPQRDYSNNVTTLDGQGTNMAVRVVVGAEKARLDGLTITGGNSSPTFTGQGMYNYQCSPIVTNCEFSGNGLGMYNYNGSPVITNCVFDGNINDTQFSTQGGGMYIGNGSPTITDCAFTGNYGDNGGGMYIYLNSAPTITHCTFRNNSSLYGGAMYVSNSSAPMVQQSFFSDNHATYSGGGVYNISFPTFTNCLFSKNIAQYTNGGGIYNHSSGSVGIMNSTFSGNQADDGGGGIHSLSPGSSNVTNSILWGDVSRLGSQEISGPATVAYSDVQGGYGGTGNMDLDPLFISPAAGDYHLHPASPVIDMGTNTGAPATDYENDSRPYDGDGNGPAVVDMGADEYTGPVCSDLPDTDSDSVGDACDNCTLVSNADQRDTNGDSFGNMCDGDLNNDGNTNATDLTLFKQVYRGSDPNADFNGDGVINVTDLTLFKGLYRKPPGPSGLVP